MRKKYFFHILSKCGFQYCFSTDVDPSSMFSYFGREWKEGKVIIFDDSFEHEVWQDADSYRLIFIVDVWHPELTAQQRRTLSPI